MSTAIDSMIAAGRVIVVTLSASILAFMTGCGKQSVASSALPTPKVTVGEVVEQETIDHDEFTGRTDAMESVDVRARVFGYLKTVEFKDGDFVDADQTLFTIEPDEYDAIHKQSLSRVEVASSKVDLAKSKLARNEKLIKSGAVSKEDYEESVAALREAEAMVLSAKADADRTGLDLKYTVIKSPIAGRIDRAYVTPGNLLTGGMTSGTLLTRVVTVDPMYVYFDIDDRSLLRYQRMNREKADANPQKPVRDQKIPCYVQLADETDFSREGVLDFAENQINTGTGTIQIRGVFDNKNLQLTPGLFVRVRVPVSDKYLALLIPDSAIATDQSVKYVYVVDGENKAIRRDVTLGALRGTMRIIRSGLKAGERVIIKGLQRVRPNQEVEPESAPPEQAATEAGAAASGTSAPGHTGPAAGPAGKSDVEPEAKSAVVPDPQPEAKSAAKPDPQPEAKSASESSAAGQPPGASAKRSPD
jgi:RND family efflux transporter MFP subunit